MALLEICNYFYSEIAIWLQTEYCWKMQLHQLRWFLASLPGRENRWDVFRLHGGLHIIHPCCQPHGGSFTSLNLPNLTPPISINTHFCFPFFLCLTPAGSSSWLPCFLQGQECCKYWRWRHFCNECPLTETVRVAGSRKTTLSWAAKDRRMVRLHQAWCHL